MTEYRWQALARLNGMTEGRVGGGSLQLVTVCLSDDGAGEVSDEHGRSVAPAPPVVTHLRPSDARACVRTARARGAPRSQIGGTVVSERSKLTSSHLRRLYVLCFSDVGPGTCGPHPISQEELRAALKRSGGWCVASVPPGRI